MTEKIQGKIQYLNEKDGQWGKSYNVKIDGETYYLKGKYPPRGIKQGDFVEVEWNYEGNYKKVEIGGMRKIDAPASAKASPPTTKAAFKAATSYDDRQLVISKQAALNTALEFIKFAAEQNALPIPAKKNEGYGYLKTVWLQEAAALFELNTGDKWELPEEDVEAEAPKPAKKAAAKKAPPKKEEPEDEDQGEFEDDELPEW